MGKKNDVAPKVTLGGELLFPSEYLSAVELKGRDVTMTIKSIALEELKSQRGTEEKPVIRFVERPKKALVLNKTNSKTIAKMYGPNADKWPGKAVTLFPTTCAAGGGEIVDCIRIRDEKPARPTKNGDAGHDDDPSPEEQAAIERELREEAERAREAG